MVLCATDGECRDALDFHVGWCVGWSSVLQMSVHKNMLQKGFLTQMMHSCKIVQQKRPMGHLTKLWFVNH
ncbi:hypothetical protein O3P69_012194 [Scylla paramamosain]|uniref:Uncharacterized protein n=1 Tax=Scylla paramamosain TaxID=85552 RepID=A0AAW0TCZ4_SCYPA